MSKTIIGSTAAFLFSMFIAILANGQPYEPVSKLNDATRGAIGVCPPFHLLDEKGNVVDPVGGVNANAPYSPKQTCGKCHDYGKITSGYHFRQGKGEAVSAEFKEKYPWVTSPGRYGGRW